MNKLHCEECDNCISNHGGFCAMDTRCSRWRKWFSQEWRRVTEELKPYFAKGAEK